MRIIVEHRTSYRFTEPQTRLIQLLRMLPDDTNAQTVTGWSIDVDCDARLRESRDGLGNRQTMLYAEGPLDGIEISVRGEVLTSESEGRVEGIDETLPPAFYLRETERTQAGEALATLVRDALLEGGVDGAASILRDRFELIEGTGDELRDAATAFHEKMTSSRELAQMLVAGLRAAEVPARYVSGYLQTPESHCAPHGWVEAYVDDGWIAVDPSYGRRVDERYVRVAIALDTAGATPVAGSRLGPGREVLDVDLRVERANGEN